MKTFLHSRFFYISISIAIIVPVILMARDVGSRNKEVLITTKVESGPVRELVSVSGIAKARQTANLAFTVNGIVQTVNVVLGDEVKAGDSLITLDSIALLAERQEAVANLARAVADRNELLNGPTISARDVTSKTVESTTKTLESTIETEKQRVTNAYRTLLSTDLTAYSNNANEFSKPPSITGTYTCDIEGTYKISVYSSNSESGYSYNLSGIESGIYSVPTKQPVNLGECGLRIQFDSNSKYNGNIWQIDIPNMKSPQYVNTKNAYLITVAQAESAISSAEQALFLAESTAINQNAPARSEAISRANAAIVQAESRISRIDSSIADRTLLAPFDGIITEIDILPGEIVSFAPVITLLASEEFEVTARIPEVDIGKLSVGQKVEMLFDAKAGETITGHIRFISLKETKIDGVSYYEATIELHETPQWIRSGLNADIEIIINEQNGGLRVPKRFISSTGSGHEVIVQKDGVISSTTVQVVLDGNDGFVSITGLNKGDIIIAP